MKTLILFVSLLVPAASFAQLLASGGYGGGYDSYGRNPVSNEIRTDRYGTRDAGRVRQVDEGEVVAVRVVKVTRSRTGTGPLVGAVAGGVVGNNVGRGRGGEVAAGVFLGAILGHHAERVSTAQPGFELVVRLRGGELISITQGVDERLRAGDRVFVIYDPSGRTRVVRG